MSKVGLRMHLRPMHFLSKQLNSTEKNGLELISVHIPKTAGTSFRFILDHIYGKRLQYIYSKEQGTSEIWRDRLPVIHSESRAIHGHFPATHTLVEHYPEAKLIAWIRDPVARIISYYNYWRGVKRHGNPNHDYFLEHNLSLLEFARLDFMKNEMIGHLNRVSLEAFTFIGIVERFDADVSLLARMMDWELPNLPYVNASLGKTTLLDRERKDLEKVLGEEIEFYHQVKRLRCLE